MDTYTCQIVMCFIVLVVVNISRVTTTLAPPTSQIAMPGCKDHCCDVSIPYPFGMGSNLCYLNEDFLITCNASTPFLRESNIEVSNINISEYGQLTVLTRHHATQCNFSGETKSWSYSYSWLRLSRFIISKSQNKFTVVGCDSFGYLKGLGGGKEYEVGCLTLCDDKAVVDYTSCSGSGCCQIDLPNGLQRVNISAGNFYSHSEVWDFSPCTNAFIVKEGNFTFSEESLKNIPRDKQFPVVLDWAIDERNTSSACKNHSYRVNASDNDPPFYTCKCNEGYQGNPYLPQGCQDVDECEEKNDCIYPYSCKNTPGNYTCSCPKGQHGDGRKNGQRCSPDTWWRVVVGVTAAVSTLVVLPTLGYCGIQKWNINKRKEKFFKENGGLVLKQLLSDTEGPTERVKIFGEDELKKATNSFDKSKIIGRGGFGTVFKGTLDQTLVAIKMSKVIDHTQIEQFINEMIILSRINHPNVVRLIGSCLETPVPLLVYEFISSKDLNYHLHEEGLAAKLPWDRRLRIAVQTAGALAYMHSDAPVHIIHRDVKSSNILLDDDFTAKVSDFGISRLVPLDQTQLSTVVQGTLGYLDPEYFHSGLLNANSDVYSFGVILVELLTGEKVISADRPENEKNLATYFVSALKDDRLTQILDEGVKNEGDPEQIKGVAELAKRCLKYRGLKRPSMKQVTKELQEIIAAGKCNNIELVIDSHDEEQPLLPPSTDFHATISSTGDNTIKNKAIELLATGR